jgi:hypothetical protein
MLRKLRISFSVGCGAVCVLLILLWVRSYWRSDSVFYFNPGLLFGVHSKQGIVRPVYSSNHELPVAAGTSKWQIRNEVVRDFVDGARIPRLQPFRLYNRFPSSIFVTIPYWFLIVVVATIGASPWLPRHFSLRTLLFATTLVALLLGSIVYAVR